jgi:hypothetical protein
MRWSESRPIGCQPRRVRANCSSRSASCSTSTPSPNSKRLGAHMRVSRLAADPRELGIPEDESAATFKIRSAMGLEELAIAGTSRNEASSLSAANAGRRPFKRMDLDGHLMSPPRPLGPPMGSGRVERALGHLQTFLLRHQTQRVSAGGGSATVAASAHPSLSLRVSSSWARKGSATAISVSSAAVASAVA